MITCFWNTVSYINDNNILVIMIFSPQLSKALCTLEGSLFPLWHLKESFLCSTAGRRTFSSFSWSPIKDHTVGDGFNLYTVHARCICIIEIRGNIQRIDCKLLKILQEVIRNPPLMARTVKIQALEPPCVKSAKITQWKQTSCVSEQLRNLTTWMWVLYLKIMMRCSTAC